MFGLIHLTHADFYADLLRDRRDPSIWIYVVQRQGSAEVLAMGTCTSQEAARDLATRTMQALAAKRSAASSTAS